jgi:hypothetical protein
MFEEIKFQIKSLAREERTSMLKFLAEIAADLLLIHSDDVEGDLKQIYEDLDNDDNAVLTAALDELIGNRLLTAIEEYSTQPHIASHSETLSNILLRIEVYQLLSVASLEQILQKPFDEMYLFLLDKLLCDPTLEKRNDIIDFVDYAKRVIPDKAWKNIALKSSAYRIATTKSESINMRFVEFINRQKDEDFNTLVDIIGTIEEQQALAEKTAEAQQQEIMRKLAADEQGIHHAGRGSKDEIHRITAQYLKILSDDFAIYNGHQISEAEVLKANTEFQHYMENFNFAANKPSLKTLKCAQSMYKIMMTDKDYAGLDKHLALVWFGLKNRHQWAGIHVPNRKDFPDEESFEKGRKLFEETLREGIISALYNAYVSYDNPEERVACPGGLKIGLALVLNHAYESMEFNQGIKIVSEKKIGAEHLQNMLRSEIIKQARNYAREKWPEFIIPALFLSVNNTTPLTDPESQHPLKSNWASIIAAAYACLWEEHPESRSQFLVMCRQVHGDLNINNPLELLKPAFDLEEEYMIFCISMENESHSKCALVNPSAMASSFLNYLKESNDSISIYYSTDHQDVIKRGLKCLTQEKLERLWEEKFPEDAFISEFSIQRHYTDFCRSLLVMDLNPDEAKRLIIHAINNPEDCILAFEQYLNVNYLNPSWLATETILLGLQNLDKNEMWDRLNNVGLEEVDIKLDDEERRIFEHPQSTSLVQKQYMSFLQTLEDKKQKEKLENAVHCPENQINDFMRYLRTQAGKLGRRNWHFPGWMLDETVVHKGLTCLDPNTLGEYWFKDKEPPLIFQGPQPPSVPESEEDEHEQMIKRMIEKVLEEVPKELPKAALH